MENALNMHMQLSCNNMWGGGGGVATYKLNIDFWYLVLDLDSLHACKLHEIVNMLQIYQPV